MSTHSPMDKADTGVRVENYHTPHSVQMELLTRITSAHNEHITLNSKNSCYTVAISNKQSFKSEHNR